MGNVKKIENDIWEVEMRDDQGFQYVTVKRKGTGKKVFCFTSGDVRVEDCIWITDKEGTT